LGVYSVGRVCKTLRCSIHNVFINVYIYTEWEKEKKNVEEEIKEKHDPEGKRKSKQVFVAKKKSTFIVW
jgi:hypothetical protein